MDVLSIVGLVFLADCTCYENNISYSRMLKVKLSLYMLQEVEAPRISGKSVHESGKVVSPTHRPPLPPGDNAGTHFC
jgi:hypothetical protein